MTEGGEQMGNPFLAAIDVIRERGWGPTKACVAVAIQTAQPSNVTETLSHFADTAEIAYRPGYPAKPIFDWNDDPVRTEEDVILALKHAAESWDESHPSPFPEPFDMDGDR
jgi:hypothetical protein